MQPQIYYLTVVNVPAKGSPGVSAKGGAARTWQKSKIQPKFLDQLFSLGMCVVQLIELSYL